MDDDLRAPDCKIFINAEVSHTELISLTAPALFVPQDHLSLQVEVVENEDYDSNRCRQFPDGFIYFRYLLDLYVGDGGTSATLIERKAAVVSRLITQLWAWGFPAVAACAYEDRLPEGGGYKSRVIPWPN